MCGIVGFLDKTENENYSIGETLLKMLTPLDERGPDSAGVALYGSRHNGAMVLQIKLGENGNFEERGRHITERAKTLGAVNEAVTTGEYLRLVIEYDGESRHLERVIESVARGLEVVSMGRRLEIVKQVGTPAKLDAAHGIKKFVGTHGLGHTRLSTESAVDLSHSQPFWAHGYPDLAIVHNGHITNYHKMRRRYEQRGIRFYTENDSEIIGIYLAEQLSNDATLLEALEASLTDLDGSFSYLVATDNAIGFAKDPFAFKPLLFTETDDYVAVATEEIAICAAFDGASDVREAQAKEVRIWER